MSQHSRIFAAITIGQAPRTDLMPDVLPLLPHGTEVREYGALDNLTSQEVAAAYKPAADDEILVSRMRDGTQVQFTEAFVTPLVQAAIDRAESDGADVVALFCTGSFPAFTHQGLFIEPFALLHAVARELAAGRRIGVLVPLAEQVPQAYELWNADGLDVDVAHASPYLDEAEVERAAASFAAKDLAFVCCDCMGYTTPMKRRIAHACNLPVVLPRTLVARTVAELLDR